MACYRAYIYLSVCINCASLAPEQLDEFCSYCVLPNVDRCSTTVSKIGALERSPQI
jgi:hypothetical protein